MPAENISHDQILAYHRREDARFLSSLDDSPLLLACPPTQARLIDRPFSKENSLVLHPGKPTFDFFDRITSTISSPEPAQKLFPEAILFAQKDKKYSLGLLAWLMKSCKPDALITIVAHNQVGGSSYVPLVNKLSNEVVASSKAHHRIISFINNASTPEVALWSSYLQPEPIRDTGYSAAAGMFSYKKIDLGSSLLIEAVASLPTEERRTILNGHGMDLGSGWGYLAGSVLTKFQEATSCCLVEIDRPSLQQSQKNLASLDDKATFIWSDVNGLLKINPRLEQSLDWVITNPPFHETRSADPELGLCFIKAAHSMLKRGGSMILVANSHLPYRPLIHELFSDLSIIYNGKGFHVYLARK
jgi:16S rRNA (guanine1207-N2)-methyltransferase